MEIIDCYRIDVKDQRQEVITFLAMANIKYIIAIRDKNSALITDKETIKKAIADISNTEINTVYANAIPYGLNYYKVNLSIPDIQTEYVSTDESTKNIEDIVREIVGDIDYYKTDKSGQEVEFKSALLCERIDNIIAITDSDDNLITNKTAILDRISISRDTIVSIYTYSRVGDLYYMIISNIKNIGDDEDEECIPTNTLTEELVDMIGKDYTVPFKEISIVYPNKEPAEDGSVPTAIDTISYTDELLEQRGNEYKIPFKSNSSALGSIVKTLLYNYRHIDNYVLGEFIYMQIKLLRHCGNPKHKDTIEDLKGYSELISRNANTLD